MDAAPAIGTVLGESYRLVRPLAQGGWGDVYVARHERLGSEVAVKLLHPGFAGNAQALARLRQEADIMSALRHPHIVQILDFDVTELGVPFLVMELLTGHPLTEGALSGVPLEPRDALHIIDQIAQALAAAHAHGIVHLDLKPDNVILVPTDGRDDFVKVIDFGISRAIWRDRPDNEPLITGTPEYMAPEQAQGMNDEIDHRTDQFALASLSYRLLTGHEPFLGGEPLAILHQVVTDTPQPPSQRAPWLGVGVDAVIDRGMSKRSADRYSDVTAFAEALAGAIDVIAIDRRRFSREPSQPLSAAPASSSMPADDSEPPERRAEPATLQFLRQIRSPGPRRRLGALLLALAAAALWWSPPRLRDAAWTACRHAGAEVRRAVVGALTGQGALVTHLRRWLS
jgi:eukaryotic-like serine/threonine-protein kinase